MGEWYRKQIHIKDAPAELEAYVVGNWDEIHDYIDITIDIEFEGDRYNHKTYRRKIWGADRDFEFIGNTYGEAAEKIAAKYNNLSYNGFKIKIDLLKSKLL